MAKFPKAATAAKVGLAAVAVGAAVAGKALYDVGKEFDDAYDKIRTSTGKTGKQLDRLKADFRNVVSSVPADFGDAATAVSELEKRLGLNHQALRRESKQFLELSRITGTDVAGNIKAVARAFEDAKIPVSEQSEKLDELYRASQKSGASVEELATNMQKFGSPLRQFGIGFDESLAMFASFEKAGVNIQTMIPGLKFALKTFLTENKDPSIALRKAFEGIEDGSIKSSKALELFGQRAGADMVEAVNQGRFHLGAFQKQVENGNDTIRKAGKETNDAGENFKLLGNKIKVLVEPAAMALYNLVGKLSGSLARLNFRKALHDAQPTISAITGAVRDLARVWAKYFLPIFKDALKGAVSALKGFAQVVKGIAEVISGVLHGEFGKAWKGVKDIFSGSIKIVLGFLRASTAPFRALAGRVGGGIADGFSAAWGKVKDVFRGGLGFIEDIIGKVIDVINLIPGVDIGGGSSSGPQHSLGADRGENRKGSKGIHRQHRQRGGVLMGGKPSGDSIPAMLERGEYVLNRNAVKKIGPKQLDALNFGMAPRFALGGIANTVTSLPGKAVSAAGHAIGSVAGKGADFFISKLPHPNIPQPFTGVGPYVINAATDFIKGKVSSNHKKLGRLSMGPGVGGFSGAPANMKQLGDNRYVDSHTLAVTAFLDKKFGLTMSSGYRSPQHNAEIGGAPGSLHTHGSPSNPGATDSVGSMGAMQAYIAYAKQHVAGLQEAMVDNYAGLGYNAHLGFFSKGGLAGWVHGSSTLSADQLASLAHYVGAKNPGLMSQIAQAESRGNPRAMGGAGDKGLWQIIPSTASAFGINYASLFDPLANARGMKKVLDGQGLGAWSTYKSGAYAGFPKGKVSPIRGAAAAAGGTAAHHAKSALAKAKARVKKGRTGKGGGTEGPFGQKRKGEPSATSPGRTSVPGLGAGSIPKILQGLGPGITSLFSGPGMTGEQKFAASEIALQLAGMTESTADDRAIYQFQRGSAQARKKSIQRQLAKINKALANNRLTQKQQAKLLRRRDELTGELGTAQGRIISANEGIKGIDEQAEQEAEEAAAKSLEEIKALLEESLALEKERAAELQRSLNVSQSQYGVLAKAIYEVTNGGIGGRLGLGFQTPSAPGKVASY